MIVEITSCAPVVAFSRPAIPPHTAPATHAATTANSTCSSFGDPASDDPAHTAA